MLPGFGHLRSSPSPKKQSRETFTKALSLKGRMYKSAEKPYLKRVKGMKAVPQQALSSVLQRTVTAQRPERGAPYKIKIKSVTQIPLHSLYTNTSLYKTRSYFH